MAQSGLRVFVAAAFRLRRLRINVVDLTANRARPPPGQPPHQFLTRDIDLDSTNLKTLFFREPFELLGLDGRPRIAIEDIAAAAVVSRGAVPDHPDT
jgi:hypothetical protein